MNDKEIRIGLASLKQAILPAEFADSDPAFTLEDIYEQIALTDAHKVNVLEGQDYANRRRLVMCIHSKTLNPEYDSSLMLHRIQKSASILRQTGLPLFVQIHTSKEETYRE